MKKLFSTIILLFAVAALYAQAQPACCPEFKLVFKRDFDCTKTQACMTAAGGGNQDPVTASMCKYSTNSFMVTPNLPGFTYTWTVTGGTPTNPTGNPVNITWGGGSTGTITVTIAYGNCVKTIKENICLRDAPVASFTFSPNNVCAPATIYFNNTSTGGAGVSWDFGDGGFAGNVNTPSHTYTLPGTYTVTLYVTNDTTPCIPTVPPGGNGDRPCCGCTSVYTQQVFIATGSPLQIIPKNCINQCLCVGDTSEYCLSVACAPPYNWTVSGGTIIAGAGTQCIKVKWTGPYPTSVSISAPNCGNPCGNTATLNVPVLVNNIPMTPITPTVCQFSTQTYSLPAMPGVFYTWIVTGGSIVGPNINTSTITVNWGSGPTGTVTCNYQNPLKPGCNGSSSQTVNIKPVLKINGPSQSCEGCTAFFYTSGGPVTWTGSTGLTFTPAVGPSTTVGFPVTGTTNTYMITATGGAYCNSPQSASIVVAPKPVLTLTSSIANACPGTQIKFVATSNVTATPINWVLPPGATMVANTGTQLDTAVIQFGSIPPGGATVTVTQNCAFGLTCSQGTASLVIKKPPVPILSSPNTTPCIDQTVAYSISNPVPGITYTWSVSNSLGTVVSGQGTSGPVNILWHGNLATSNQGVLTVSNCSGSATANITVTVPTAPTISVGGTCIKTGMTLTSSPASTYAWTGPGIVGPANTQTININQPGQYCVTINASLAGSCPQQKCVTIQPNPYWVKIIPPCSVASCNPNSLSVLLTIGTNIPSPSNCKWWRIPPGGGAPILVSALCANFTATQLGTYYLVITDPNGCLDTSNIVRIPEDINICCTTPVCSALSSTHFLFTHSGCQPTTFTGTPLSLPPGWTTGTLHPTICYGDGTADDFISLNTTHQYAAAGVYTVCVVQKVVKTATNDTCCISDCKQVTIPVVTKFTASYNCNTGLLTMTDGSSYYPSSTGASYAWSITGGTYTGTLTNGPNQSVTPTSSGNFNITLAITLNGCTSTYSLPVLVVLPAAPINVAPNPTCDGSPVFFSTTPGMASYNWQFGDNGFSLTAAPQHIYPGPGAYTVTLTVVTPDGCTVTKTATINVQPKPTVKVTPNPITICPGSSVTLTATITNTNGNTMCPLISSYTLQWYNNGAPLGAPTNSPSITVNNYGSYYAVLTGNSPACNCVIKTDTAVVSWFPKPIAKIKGKSTVCLNGGSGTVALSNAVTSYPGYAWSSSNPGNISFDFNNVYNPNVTINAPGNYSIYLMVTDANGCTAYDTLCIFASNSPTVSINTPGGPLCSGNVYNLQAIPTPPTAPPAGYAYLWSTGATTVAINASAPGAYSVILTDMNTGCSASSSSVLINPGPNLSLFPTCCDTICDDAPINISVPLPLGPGQTICSTYTIVWLDNGVPVSPQPSPCNTLNTASLTPLLGQHNLSVIVTYNGCTDTSDVFHLFIRHCGCDCKGSHWGEIQIVEGDHPAGKAGPMAGISAAQVSQKSNVNVGANPITLNCGSSQKLDCNKTYTVSANYICADSACTGIVKFSLQPPSGAPITGTGSLTFTPSQTGIYVLTIYGWCGDKICDSCIIKFEVNCVPCDCKGSHWGEMSVSDGNNTQPVSCNKQYPWKCRVPFTVSANYICAKADCQGTVSYSLTLPNGSVTTSNSPITYTPTAPGTYTVVMYGMCGGKICDSCVVKFIVEKCPELPCCPYTITVKDSSIQTTVINNPDATVANGFFSITGPTGNLFTQVRAEVVSYGLFSNFNNECLSCKSYPFTWASIYKAGNIGALQPQITMYNSTAPSFNPAGGGMYQNPREVIWTGTTPFALPNNINLQFLLPPPSVIDCCELTAKICVKFTFRDKDCKECEALVCFSVTIKKK